jgi:hypothetical protein
MGLKEEAFMIKRLMMVGLVAAVASGCGTPVRMWKNENLMTGKVTPKEFLKGKTIFVMPVNMHVAGAEPTATNPLGLAFFAGMAGKFGDGVVGGQILIDVVEKCVPNLSFDLAEAILASVTAGLPQGGNFKGAKFPEAYAAIPDKMVMMVEKFVATLKDLGISDKLKELKINIPDPFKIDYVLAAHMHEHAGSIPKTTTLEIWGGIYDVNTKDIVSATWFEKSAPEDKTQKIAAMAGAAGKLWDALMEGII